jgi:serine/threonine protein kinase
MSPEQIRDPSGVDIRADIYSLGCVLYHALAGVPPFVDLNPVRLLGRIAQEEHRPLSLLNPRVPPGLEQILNWMLAKDPEKRYPTPDRAAQALEVFMSAGAEPSRLEKDVQMRPYLEWLATQSSAGQASLEPQTGPTEPKEVPLWINVEPVTHPPTRRPPPLRSSEETPPLVDERGVNVAALKTPLGAGQEIPGIVHRLSVTRPRLRPDRRGQPGPSRESTSSPLILRCPRNERNSAKWPRHHSRHRPDLHQASPLDRTGRKTSKADAVGLSKTSPKSRNLNLSVPG